MPDTDAFEILRAEARLAQQRLDLYRAKAYGMRATSPERMRELEHRATAAGERLAFAEQTRAEEPRP